jgi:hypothetical protein
MIRLVKYTVKPQHAAENERLVRAVFEALHAAQPDGLRYSSLKGDDGVTFMHLVSHESESSRDVLTTLPAFKAFLAGLRDRCAEAPAFTELNAVGSYRLFDSAEVHG